MLLNRSGRPENDPIDSGTIELEFREPFINNSDEPVVNDPDCIKIPRRKAKPLGIFTMVFLTVGVISMIIYHFASTPSQSSTSSQSSTPSQSCPTGQIINKEYGICENICPVGFHYNQENDKCEIVSARASSSVNTAQNWVASNTLIWSDRVIFYTYNYEAKTERFTNEERRAVRKAMDTIIISLGSACIDFVELSKVDPATKKTIRIIKDGNICSSDVGFQHNKVNVLKLGTDCFKHPGTIIHELLHSLGVYHQMNRPDRHLYLDVPDKIDLTIAEDNFKVKNITDYDMTLKVPFDFFSIMMYKAKIQNITTMKVNKYYSKLTNKGSYPLEKEMTNLSPVDIMALSIKYSCDILPTPDVKKDYIEYTLDMLEVMADVCAEACRDETYVNPEDACSYDCQTIRVEIQELLIDLDIMYRDYFTNKQLSRYDSLESKCSTNIERVSLVKWLSNSTFENKYKSYELPKCKSKRLGN